MLSGVTSVLNFSSLGQQALATLGSTTAKDSATILSGHTGTESELTLAAALGRLVSAFAHDEIFLVKKGDWRCATRLRYSLLIGATTLSVSMILSRPLSKKCSNISFFPVISGI